jgi:hypothetical protein
VQAQVVAETNHQQSLVCDEVSDVDSLDDAEKRDVDLLPAVRTRDLLGSLLDQCRDELLCDDACENDDGDEDVRGYEYGDAFYVASGPFGLLLV